MAGKFPHIADTNFPNAGNVDVYKYANNLDYSRYDTMQMTITVMNVPWDMGEAHVGQRTVSGIGNIVAFGSKAERDSWFNSVPANEKYVFETKFRKFHAQDEIKLPIPFDVAAQFNYCLIEYTPVPGSMPYLEYEKASGQLKWFYFIRSVESDSPNSTIAHIKRDTWQTYIYDVNITHMILEQGHAPVSVSNVDAYLADPVNNNEWITTPDVNFGEASQVKYEKAVILNSGNMYAVIVSTASPHGYFGSKADNDWQTPANSYYSTQGAESLAMFAVPVDSLHSLLAAIDANAPQFKQTVQGVFIVSDKLLTVGDTFTFCGVTCHYIGATQKALQVIDFDKSQFGYESRYEHLAKLYTAPYAYLEISGEDGRIVTVNVEDCAGSLTLNATLSLSWPWINIDGFISGIGKGTRHELTFKNISDHTFAYSGRWYGSLRSWNVPVYAVVQSGRVNNDYATHYNRRLETATADNNAANITANNALAVAANNSTTANSNAANSDGVAAGNYKIGADCAWDLGVTNAGYSADLESNAVAATNNNINAAAGAISTVTSVAAQALTGNVAGAVTTGINGAVSTGAGWATSNASINVAMTNLTSVYNQTVASANGKKVESVNYNLSATDIQNSLATQNTAVSNNLNTGVATNNANLTQTNATNSVNSQVAQAAIGAPAVFGNWEGGQTGTTRPQALFANIVTQSKGAIRQAGDHFLRFGYALNQAWDFDGFNLMPKFTYWKCSDIWVEGLQVPDEYMDEIRFFLLGGVTIWRDPADIGRTSIYDNV